MKGGTLINVEPGEPEPMAQPNINILTGGGKTTGGDVKTFDQSIVIRLASTNKSYDSNQ